LPKVLLDHGVTRLLAPMLSGHIVKTAREMGWDRLGNGALLAAAANDAFNVFLTVDKKLRKQQNVGKLPLPVIAIDAIGNILVSLAPYAPDILSVLSQRLERRVYVIPRRP